MKFKILDNGKEILCDIVTTFKDFNTGIKYIVYTDGTKDENNNLEIYASRYEKDGEDYILNEIENEYEWDIIDEVLQKEEKV